VRLAEQFLQRVAEAVDVQKACGYEREKPGVGIGRIGQNCLHSCSTKIISTGTRRRSGDRKLAGMKSLKLAMRCHRDMAALRIPEQKELAVEGNLIAGADGSSCAQSVHRASGLALGMKKCLVARRITHTEII